MALSLGTNLDDPKTQALLALGLGLLGSRGSFGQSLSDAGQQALGVYNSGRQRQGTEELRALQKRQSEMGLLQAQRAMEEADNIKRTRGSFLDAIDPNAGPAMQPSLVGAMRAGFSPQEAAAFMPSRPESNFAKIDPKDYTPESLAEYVQTGNAAVLRPRTKMEFVDGQAVDPFNVKPGTVIQPRTPANNPWQDLLIPGPNGVPVPNSPLIRAREQIAAAAPGVQVSYGAPVAGEDKQGNRVFFQPSKDGKTPPAIIQGVQPSAQNRDNKPPAEIQRMNIAIDTMGQMLNDYEAMLKKYNPRDPLVQASPSVRAEFQSLMKGIQLQFKEVQALGALAGPDLAIMESAITDPFTFRGVFYGKDGLLGQINQSRKLLAQRKKATEENIKGIQGNSAPAADDDPLGIRGGR